MADAASPTTGSTPVAPTTGPVPTDPTAASTPDAGGSPVTLDNDALNGANGDPAVWGNELARFFTALTGAVIEPSSLVSIFGAFGSQVQSQTYRQAAIAIANNPIANVKQSRETLVAVMDQRADLAELLLQTVA